MQASEKEIPARNKSVNHPAVPITQGILLYLWLIFLGIQMCTVSCFMYATGIPFPPVKARGLSWKLTFEGQGH